MSFKIAAVDVLAEDSKMRAFFNEHARAAGFEFQAPVDATGASRSTALQGAGALVSRNAGIDGAVMDECGPSLRLIHVQGGLPDRIDLVEAARRGIAVATMRSLGCIAVAEHTMALILAVTRKIVPGHAATIAAAHETLGLAPVRTSEAVIAFNWMKYPDIAQLYGKTLAIVGFGEIAQELARRARAFDMRVVYYRRSPLSAAWERDLGVEHAASLTELLAQADVLSLLVPHTEHTEHMIGAAELARLKPGGIFINTARGGLVDEVALADALRSRRVAAAGLDVFDYEPLPRGHAFTTLDNVVLTPHLGGGTGGGHKRHIEEIVANIARFVRGEAVLNLV
jgi:glyoxylate reductase